MSSNNMLAAMVESAMHKPYRLTVEELRTANRYGALARGVALAILVALGLLMFGHVEDIFMGERTLGEVRFTVVGVIVATLAFIPLSMLAVFEIPERASNWYCRRCVSRNPKPL